MATPCEIVFIDECNFVNYGSRFFIDEVDEAEDEEEYEISETDSSDFSSDFSEQEDTSSSEEESPIPTTSVSGRRRKKSTKKQATKKPQGKQAAHKKGKVGGKKNKFLTKTELDELTDKLKDKRPVCWSFVSEKLGKQPVINHSEAHRYVIEYILDKRYSELRHFVDHMYSSYIKLIGEIENEAKTDRKALLTMRWTNSLDTVLESDVCQSVYAGLPGNYSTPRIIRAVTGIIHSLVYDFAQTKSFSFSQPVDTSFSVTPEDDVALYRISGAALCQMIKLRKDTLSGKEGRRELTSERRTKMECELEILLSLRENDKSHLPNALRLLDEGFLTYVKEELLQFVREADMNIREFVNERKLKRHKNNFLEVVHYNVYNDEELLKTFNWSVEKCGVSREMYSTETIKKVFSDMLHKLCHTRTKEFFRSKIERDLAASGKVVDADQSLRDNLKTYSVLKK